MAPFPSLIFSLLILIIPYITKAHITKTPTNLVRSSCSRATYPTICIRTLSNYTGTPVHNLLDLAQAGVGVSLSRAKKMSKYLSALARDGKHKKRKENKTALSDCVEQIEDAVSELTDTARELKKLEIGSFGWRINNVKTWVSAALTCQSTCLDGIKESSDNKMINEDDVKRKIRNLTKVTSNALCLINLLDYN